MTLFETAKSVPILEIVQRYGIQTEKKGRRTFCTCPDRNHPDSHPSALLNTDGQVNTFKCMSCGAKGSNIDLVMLLFGLTAKESAQKIVDEFCGGKYDKGSRFEARKARTVSADNSKILKLASAYKSIWEAKYKHLDDLQKTEDDRIENLESVGYEMSEQENMDYIKSISCTRQEQLYVNAVIHTIEDLKEKGDLDYLAGYLYAISEGTNKVYDDLLMIDNRTDSNYVRGIDYANR